MPILVTTALEDLDYTNQDVLFLGEWCKRYLTKEDLSKDIGSTVPYHWDDREKLYNDYKYIADLCEKKLYPAITTGLNKFHNVNYSIRYWKIILGPWLGSFMACLLDRWEMVMIASERYDIDSVLLYTGYKDLVPIDPLDFKNLCVEDLWNNYIYSCITKNYTSLSITRVSIDNVPQVKSSFKTKLKSRLKRLRSRLYDAASFFARNNTIVFFDSYMPKITQWKIEFELGQVPSIRSSYPCEDIKKPESFLERSNFLLDFQVDNEFEEFLQYIFPRQIPVAFLEGYSDLVKQSFSSLFPKSPTVIFTSNSHLVNDIFKIWCARNVENGAKLVAAQHGGGYGTTKYDLDQDHERTVPDYFLTWGWEDNSNKLCTPFYATKQLVKDNRYNSKKKEGVLHVLYSLTGYTRYILANPCSSQYIKYMNDQNRFINSIDHSLIKHHNIRKHPNSYDWGELGKITLPNINISFDSNKHFLKSLYSHKLIVVTANETIFLQVLVSGIPMVAFWDHKLNELSDHAVVDYNNLSSIGILHDSPESAAIFINKIWNNIEAWWENENLQKMRRQFCYKYARTTTDNVSEWLNFFKTLDNG